MPKDKNNNYLSFEFLGRVILVLFTLMVGVSSGVTAWSASQVVNAHQKIASIEATRFTKTDGINLTNAITKAFHDLEIQVSKTTQAGPPVWFIEKFDKLEQRVKKLEVEP